MEHLIPSDWFQDLHWLVLLGLVAVSMMTLMLGADWLVESASSLARRLGVPAIIVGATIVSLGTTAPECAVSVMAAWEGNSGLALGNAVGSVIADTGLIFGLGCLITRLPVNRFLLSRQGWVQFGSALLLAGLCYGLWSVHGESAVVPRWAGAMFLVLLVAYMIVSVRWSLQTELIESAGDLAEPNEPNEPNEPLNLKTDHPPQLKQTPLKNEPNTPQNIKRNEPNTPLNIKRNEPNAPLNLKRNEPHAQPRKCVMAFVLLP